MSRYCENCIKPITCRKYIFGNPDFFTKGEIYEDCITNRNKNFDLYLKKCHFKLA